MSQRQNFISAFSSYIVARVTNSILKSGPNQIDFAKGRANFKKLNQYAWYRMLKQQYASSWEWHPTMIELASHIDFAALETEDGIANLVDTIRSQLTILEWK